MLVMSKFKLLNQSLSITRIAADNGVEVRNNMACCPFHNDSRPSMIISDERNSYKCFACDAYGDAIDFYARLHDMSMVDAAIKLVDEYALDFKFSQRQKYAGIQLEPITESQINYLSGRGVEHTSILEFEFGSHKGNVAFPIKDENNKYVGHQSRSIGDNKQYYSNFPKSEILGFLNVAKEMGPTTLVSESYLDCVMAWQEGVACVTTFSRSMSPRQVELLNTHFTKVILAFDNDDAGIAGTLDAYEKIKINNPIKDVRFASFSGKDVGEHFYRHSKIDDIDLVDWATKHDLPYEKIVNMIKKSRSFVERRLFAMRVSEMLKVKLDDVFYDLDLVK